MTTLEYRNLLANKLIREFVDNFKKQMKKTMPLSDQLDMRDPQSIAEFA